MADQALLESGGSEEIVVGLHEKDQRPITIITDGTYSLESLYCT